MYGPCISMTWIKKRQTQRQNGFSKLTLLSLLKVVCHFRNKNCWIMSHTIWQNFASCMHCEDFSKLLFPECSDSQTSKLHFQPRLWTKFCPCQAFCLVRYKWKWDWSWPCFDQSLYYVNDVLLMSFFTLVQEGFFENFLQERERSPEK